MEEEKILGNPADQIDILLDIEGNLYGFSLFFILCVFCVVFYGISVSLDLIQRHNVEWRTPCCFFKIT